MAVRYEHSGNAAPTTLSTSITNVSTSINITSASGWPNGSVGPFWVTVDAGTASEEKVLCTSRTGLVLAVTTRGADGTTATSHASGAAIIHSYSATEADDANALAAGITTAGGAVTLNGVQTLTNKTLALGSNTVSGTLAQLNAAVTDADVASLAGAETLTNKTLTAPSGDVARGALSGGYAQVTANQGGITTEVDLTGLAVTVTVGAGRRILIRGCVRASTTVAQDSFDLKILEGATVLQTAEYVSPVVARAEARRVEVVLTPSAGSHTYKLTGVRSTGTGTFTMNAGATFPAYILVEDIGI